MCTLVCNMDVVFCQEKGTDGLVYVWSSELERNLQYVEMTETYQRGWMGEHFVITSISTGGSVCFLFHSA